MSNPLWCSFCGKEQADVKRLIAGATAFICDECVSLCVDIIARDPDGDPLKSNDSSELRKKMLELKEAESS